MTKQEVMQYALNGLAVERARIEGIIREINATLRGKQESAPVIRKPRAGAKKRNKMSAAGRAAIAAAQKKRWAKVKQQKALLGALRREAQRRGIKAA